MARRPHRFSIFAQRLDRAAFLAYFLGAVVPLAALAWVVHRFVGPALAGREALWGAFGALASIGLLSLVAFLVLRQVARAALARADRENRRLAALLAAARALAASTEEREILHVAARAAAEVAEARAGFYLARAADGESFERVEPRQLPEELDRPSVRAAVEGAADEALETLAPAIRGEEAAGVTGGLAMAAALAAAAERPGALVVWHDDERPLDPAATAALSTLAALATVARRNAALHAGERNFFVHATQLLVTALDTHLAHQSDHSRRVAQLANRIGRELGLPEPRLERLHFAALLHDIGMLRVDRARLADREAVRVHAAAGAEMLRPIQLWEDLAPIVRHHHEWFDGNGYPDGLRGERIPLEARIIAVAETYDVLTSDQSYQSAIPVAEAVARIEASAGVQFDPTVVAAFRRVRAELAAL